MVFSVFSASWSCLFSVKDLLACWRGAFKGHQSADVWNAIPQFLMRYIWEEQNSWSFEGVELP